MSPAADRDDVAPPSFVRNLAGTLAWMLLCGVVGPLFLVIYFASGSSDLIGWMLWTGLAVTALDVAIAVAMAVARTRSQRRTHRLRRTGKRATAQVLSVEQTGVRINDQPMVELHVRITGPDVAPFEATSRSVVSEVRLPLLYAGPVPVVVDPETAEWEFDWDAARPAISPVVAASSPGDRRPAAERLAELDGLLQRDLVSREEYDAARARILGGL